MSSETGSQTGQTMHVGYGVLMPPAVFNQMRDLELAFASRYGENPGLHQPPHITLKAPFDTKDLSKHRWYLDDLRQSVGPVDVRLTAFRSSTEA